MTRPARMTGWPQCVSPQRESVTASRSSATIFLLGRGFTWPNGVCSVLVAAPDPEAPRADGCGHLPGSVPPTVPPQETDVGCSEPPTQALTSVPNAKRGQDWLARHRSRTGAPGTSPSVSSPSAVGAPRGADSPSRCRHACSRCAGKVDRESAQVPGRGQGYGPRRGRYPPAIEQGRLAAPLVHVARTCAPSTN